jgi:hypothetical protein
VTPTTVSVTFEELVTTSFGETISVVGSIAALGNWNPDQAVALSAAAYTGSNPLWFGTVPVVAGTSFQYKYIKKQTDGTIVWESDPNRSLTVPARCGVITQTLNDSWR